MKKMLLVCFLVQAVIPIISAAGFVPKNKPFDTKHALIGASVGTAVGFIWWFNNINTRESIKSSTTSKFFYTSKILYFTPVKKKIHQYLGGTVGILSFVAFMTSLWEYNNFKNWNNRIDDQVYKDAKDTHAYVLTSCAKAAELPEDTQDMVHISQKIIAQIDLSETGSKQKIAVVKKWCIFLLQQESILADHRIALEERLAQTTYQELIIILKKDEELIHKTRETIQSKK
ncbi:hypothetical protein H0X48_03565 [Candidatus Dependentiae bacterium]|nr:hypothetical protein [Candidatus Dependentiae bacterium]